MRKPQNTHAGRRGFLKTAAVGAAALAGSPPLKAQHAAQPSEPARCAAPP